MSKSELLLSNVWREACRHIEISESTETIAAILVEHMPVGQVLVRQIEPERSCLETVAVGFPLGEHPPAEARADGSAAEMEAVAAWCDQGAVTRRANTAQRPDAPAIVFTGATGGDVLAGPLKLRSGRGGVLVLSAIDGHEFADRHVALMQMLLEPFSVALDNDHQLRELAALREAAEADKRSLLTRLGRQELGDTIVGIGSGLRGVMDRVELVARSDAPVLIFGETGTGKELIARTIHTRSPRHDKPFQRVNCGAIPPELIDSQLFGHERGAFTGAVETRKGWFERADGGTLFLDEIGELPLAAQVRLLRILQDGWMERVGGEHAINVDVRIVAATHRDLAAMVAENRFREDLWYRIAVFPIILPPLRERREDIASLAEHFAERAATRFGLYRALPTREDIQRLQAYPWPGNVRELGTVIDRAAILGDGKRLEIAKALGATTDITAVPMETQQPKALPAVEGPIASLDAAIRRHIEAALTAAHGRIEGPHGAATMLDINPHTLRAKMRKLGIEWSRYREGR